VNLGLHSQYPQISSSFQDIRPTSQDVEVGRGHSFKIEVDSRRIIFYLLQSLSIVQSPSQKEVAKKRPKPHGRKPKSIKTKEEGVTII
jgi:hypothetical protein